MNPGDPPLSSSSSQRPPEINPALRPRKRLSTSRRIQTVKTVIFLVLLGAIIVLATSLLLDRRRAAMERVNCTGQCIVLRKSGADPVYLSVISGSFVEFATADGQKHNLRLDPSRDGEAAYHSSKDAAYQSGDFGPGQSWKVEFRDKGIYSFIDTYHPKNKIDIIVNEAE